jgi:hypothetical protein
MSRTLMALAFLPLAALAVSAADDKKDDKGWVQLFNGKDLTGWKTHPDDKAKWEVKDGNIVGTGPVGHLFSDKDTYENFHYRIEAKVNDKGNSGQYFRTQFGKGFPKGYEAQINSTHTDKVRTGSLYGFKDCLIFEQLHKPDEWFIQEVIADGNHIQIFVNGKKTVDTKDEANKYSKGHFAIQQHDPGTVVTVKKIEYKELPATKK